MTSIQRVRRKYRELGIHQRNGGFVRSSASFVRLSPSQTQLRTRESFMRGKNHRNEAGGISKEF